MQTLGSHLDLQNLSLQGWGPAACISNKLLGKAYDVP